MTLLKNFPPKIIIFLVTYKKRWQLSVKPLVSLDRGMTQQALGQTAYLTAYLFQPSSQEQSQKNIRNDMRWVWILMQQRYLAWWALLARNPPPLKGCNHWWLSAYHHKANWGLRTASKRRGLDRGSPEHGVLLREGSTESRALDGLHNGPTPLQSWSGVSRFLPHWSTHLS